MTSITRNGAATPEPGETQQSNQQALSKPMDSTIKALIECHIRDAKVFDRAALQAEIDAAADLNAQKPYSPGNARVIEYRNMARSEMAALVALLQHQYPRFSLEQRCDYVQANTSLTPDDVNRIWNALVAVS